jgi:hypothetical protein
MEIPQPLALPDAIRERVDLDARRLDAQHVRQAVDHFRRRGLEGIQGLQPRMRPQPEFTRRRLQDGVVVLVGVRHGHRAELEAGFFDARGVESVQRHRDRELRHVASYLSPSRRSR